MAEALQREDTVDNFFEDWMPEIDYGLTSNLAVQPEERPIERPEERPEPRRRIRPLERPEPKVKPRRDGSKVVFLLSALILLVGSLGVITTYSDVYAKQAHIRELNAELEETKQMTVILSEDPIQNVNMNEVYRFATEKLGMVEATGADTTFIHVGNRSYTEVYEPAQKEEARVTFHWFS